MKVVFSGQDFTFFLLGFFYDVKIVLACFSDGKGKVVAMNILTKLGLGACVIFGVLSGGYYLLDHRANENLEVR